MNGREAEIERIMRIWNLTYTQATRYVESVEREASAGRLIVEEREVR